MILTDLNAIILPIRLLLYLFIPLLLLLTTAILTFSNSFQSLVQPLTRALKSPARTMSWRSSGTTNSELVNNLFRNSLISEERVKDAFLATDRAHFAPSAPYADRPQGIGHAATISAPHMHALACKHLLPVLNPGAKVLDVGSGSGYLSAIFAHLVAAEESQGGSVVGIEHIQALVDLATTNLGKSEDGRKMMHERHVQFVCGDGRKGYAEGAPYDAIHVGAAALNVHEELTSQLKNGGKMFIPVGDYEQHIWMVEKDDSGEVTKKKLFGVQYVPLTDAPGGSEA